MAWKSSSETNPDGSMNFYADTVADVADLPKQPYYGKAYIIGSTCLVTSTSEVYILSPSLTWTKLE